MSGPRKYLEVEGYSKITRNRSRLVVLDLHDLLGTTTGTYHLKVRFTARTVKVRYWTVSHGPCRFYSRDVRRTDGLPLALGVFAALGWRSHLGLEPLLDWVMDAVPEVAPVIADWLQSRRAS